VRLKLATLPRFLILASLPLAGAAMAGCQESAPPRHVRAPRQDEGPLREYDAPRPLPDQQADRDEVPPPPFVDEPLVIQATPEQRAYVHAYEDVGRPTVAVFVNRSIDAEPLGKNKPGYANELGTRSIDYEAMENILTDWLAADGKVEIISPTGVRERLGEGDTRDLESGKLKRDDAGRKLHADVLVQVRAQITRQTPDGPEVRLVAESINVNGGQSIARGVVDVPPPLTKPQLNRYTRFIARKLMDGMIGSWQRLATDPPRGSGGEKEPLRTAPPKTESRPEPAPESHTEEPAPPEKAPPEK
jgi:hypothetical protein